MLCRIKGRIPVLITRQVATLTHHQPIQTTRRAQARGVAPPVVLPEVGLARVPVVVLVVLALARVVLAVNLNNAAEAGLAPAFSIPV